MNEHSTPNAPFKTLGTHLRYLREQSEETTADLSGAVEIDEQVLHRMEDGLERPSEEILLLIMSHFDLEEDAALQLWQLAGYDGAPEAIRLSSDEADTPQLGQSRAVVMLALDARVIYSDCFEAVGGKSGITLNFAQHSSSLDGHNDDQHNVVSRVGMSYEQAEQVMQSIQQALLKAKFGGRGPKSLPPGPTPHV